MRIDTELLDLEIGNEEQRELGPLKYLAEQTGKDMGTVVNWFLLLIIFVFDPLAIALVVAANFAFAQINPTRKKEILKITRKIKKEPIQKKTEEVKTVPKEVIMEELSQTEISRELDKNDEEPKEELSETDKQFDKNNDGVLDEEYEACDDCEEEIDECYCEKEV